MDLNRNDSPNNNNNNNDGENPAETARKAASAPRC